MCQPSMMPPLGSSPKAQCSVSANVLWAFASANQQCLPLVAAITDRILNENLLQRNGRAHFIGWHFILIILGKSHT